MDLAPSWSTAQDGTVSPSRPQEAAADQRTVFEPTSNLLQSLLREKRAEARRQSQSFDGDTSSLGTRSYGHDPHEIQSSPSVAMTRDMEGQRKDKKKGGDVGKRSVSAPKAMGMREMEEVYLCLLVLRLFHAG